MPTKNYTSFSVKTTSQDDYVSFEKTYTFPSIYRRVIGRGSLGAIARGIVCTADIGAVASGYIDTKYCATLSDITYVRIKNISSSSDLHIHGYSTGVDGGNKYRFTIESGETIQFHSKLKMGDHDSTEVNWLYLGIAASSTSNSGADIFVGCSS